MKIQRKKVTAIDFGRHSVTINKENLPEVDESIPSSTKQLIHNMKETKELLSFIFSLIYATDRAFEDKKFTTADIFKYTGAVKKLPAGLSGIEKIPNEVKNINEETLNELRVFIIEEFNLTNDKQEEVIENIISTAITFANAFVAYREAK